MASCCDSFFVGGLADLAICSKIDYLFGSILEEFTDGIQLIRRFFSS